MIISPKTEGILVLISKLISNSGLTKENPLVVKIK